MAVGEPSLDIVVPCYNEEAVLNETFRQLSGLMADMIKHREVSADSRLYFVDDGSRDSTWSMIKARSMSDRLVCGVKLSRNRGHQNALLAGLEKTTGEIAVTVDADLQDDIQVIRKMVAEYRSGSDIVYGVRSSRESDTFFKRHTAQLFYKLMNRFGVTTIYNHADYRLMSRRAIESLAQFDERNMYLRGIIPLIGFKASIVAYERRERFAGESKYPLSKMLSLALDGITSFSTTPLKMITMLGFLVFAGSILASIAVIWIRFSLHTMPTGWASTVLPLFLLGGIQILCIGVLGIYLGKVYTEVKGRPRFFIEEVSGQKIVSMNQAEVQSNNNHEEANV
jgi:glycosyltransferase involved in cell wall biosynthesis